MPVLSVDSCSTKYNYTDVTDDCMDKMKKNSCGHDDTVWIKCAEVVDDGGGSSSTKVSATTILFIFKFILSKLFTFSTKFYIYCNINVSEAFGLFVVMDHVICNSKFRINCNLRRKVVSDE